MEGTGGYQGLEESRLGVGVGRYVLVGLWGWETPAREKKEVGAKLSEPSFVYTAGSPLHSSQGSSSSCLSWNPVEVTKGYSGVSHNLN